MKSITSRALIAVVATALSLGGLSAVYAQSTAAPAAPNTAKPAAMGQMGARGGHHHMGPGARTNQQKMAPWGNGMRANLVNLVCSDRGAEALDIAFVRLSYRLKPTPDQQAAFDDLKSTALQEQTKFSDACAGVRPRADAGQKPDPVEMMKARITLETARLAAMNAVLPKFETLYSSLTDEQKAALMPSRMGGQGPAWGQHRWFGNQMRGQMGGQWQGRMPGQGPAMMQDSPSDDTGSDASSSN